MGTLSVSGNGVGIVVATGEKTEFGQVFLMMKEIEDKKTPLQVKMDDLGKKLSIMSFGIIGLIFVIGAFSLSLSLSLSLSFSPLFF